MKYILLPLTLIILLNACTGPKPATEAVPENIINKYWKLITLNGQPVQMAEGQERETHLILRQGGQLGGHTGCNTLNGSYVMHTSRQLQFKDITTTLRYCAEVPYESAFNQALHQTETYRYRNDTLWLQGNRQQLLASFAAVYLD